MQPRVYIWAEGYDELITRFIHMYEELFHSLRCFNASICNPNVVMEARALVVILDQDWCNKFLHIEHKHDETLDNRMALAISLALRRGIPVFPVLLNGASFPKFSDIPPEFSGLMRSQAYSISPDDSVQTADRVMWLFFLIEMQLGLRDVTFTPVWIGLAFACLEVAVVAIGVVMHTMLLAVIGAALLISPLYFSLFFSLLGPWRNSLCIILLYGGEGLLAIIWLGGVPANFWSIAGTALGTLMIVGFFYLFPIWGFYGRARVGGGEILIRRAVKKSRSLHVAAVREFFLSYRREDSEEFTQRIYNFLSRKGRGAFLDKMAIIPGANFIAQLYQMLDESIIMFVIIGPKWISEQFPSGGRRIDDPSDYVRLEIAAGLRKNKKVVPILVDETEMPTRNELPGDLAQLTHSWPYQVHSDERFSVDMSRVLREMQSYLSPERFRYWDIAIGITVSTALFLAPVVITPLISWMLSGSEGVEAANMLALFPEVASFVFILTCLSAIIHGLRSRQAVFVVVLVAWTALTFVMQMLTVAAASSSSWQFSVIATTFWIAFYIGVFYLLVGYSEGYELIVRRSRAQTTSQQMASLPNTD